MDQALVTLITPLFLHQWIRRSVPPTIFNKVSLVLQLVSWSKGAGGTYSGTAGATILEASDDSQGVAEFFEANADDSRHSSSSGKGSSWGFEAGDVVFRDKIGALLDEARTMKRHVTIAFCQLLSGATEQ